MSFSGRWSAGQLEQHQREQSHCPATSDYGLPHIDEGKRGRENPDRHPESGDEAEADDHDDDEAEDTIDRRSNGASDGLVIDLH